MEMEMILIFERQSYLHLESSFFPVCMLFAFGLYIIIEQGDWFVEVKKY